MLSKPVILKLWPLLFALIAFSLPVQIMLLYGHGLTEFSAVISKLTIFNWMVMAGLLICAYGIYEATRWALAAVYILMAIVAVNNFFVGYMAVDYSLWTALFSTVAFAGINLPLIRRPELRFLFAHPEQQWWRAAVRKQIHIPVKLNGLKKLQLRAETFDISVSGMFVPMTNEEAEAIEMEQVVHVCLTFNKLAQFRCDARVTRRTLANGRYPSGVGLQFLDLSSQQINELRRHLRKQTPQADITPAKELNS